MGFKWRLRSLEITITTIFAAVTSVEAIGGDTVGTFWGGSVPQPLLVFFFRSVLLLHLLLLHRVQPIEGEVLNPLDLQLNDLIRTQAFSFEKTRRVKNG